MLLDTRIKPTWVLPHFHKQKSSEFIKMCFHPNHLYQLAPLFGLSPSLQVKQMVSCVLSGHAHGDRDPSAQFYVDRNDVLNYTCFRGHENDKGEFRHHLLLPEVYAARAYKQLKKLKDPELATWGLRMLVEARILHPVNVVLPTLHNPEKYSESVLRVYHGLQLLFQSKWHYDFGASTPLAWRFGAAWCGVSQEYFMKGLHVLLSRGIIVMDGNFNDEGDFIPKTHKGTKLFTVPPF